jgi:hypothetical protein
VKVPGFIGGAYTSQSPNADAEKCLNLYPEMTQPGNAKSPIVLYATPGLRRFTKIGNDPVRAMNYLNDRYFAVAGDKFVELRADGTFATWGTVVNDNLPASLSANGNVSNQVFIVSGGHGYLFYTGDSQTDYHPGTPVPGAPSSPVLKDTFLEIPDEDFPVGAKMGGYTDSYFFALRADGISVQFSALSDGQLWDGLDVLQRQKTPDSTRCMFVSQSEIWLFGGLNTEIWVHTGNADTPFEPLPGTIIPIGIASPYAAVKVGDLIAWFSADISGDSIFYVAPQYKPQRMSTHAVEAAWRRYTTVQDVECFAYQSEGHTFAQLNFPSAKATWVFDLATQLWHERAYRNPVNNELECHLARNHVFAFNRHLVGSRRDGTVYHMSNQHTSDDNARILRVRRSAHTSEELQMLFFSYFQLDFQAGVGGIECNPQIMLRWSDDGGHVWNEEQWESAGAQGEYSWRAMWRRLGKSRERIWEISMTENVYWCLIDAYCGVTKGMS